MGKIPMLVLGSSAMAIWKNIYKKPSFYEVVNESEFNVSVPGKALGMVTVLDAALLEERALRSKTPLISGSLIRALRR